MNLLRYGADLHANFGHCQFRNVVLRLQFVEKIGILESKQETQTMNPQILSLDLFHFQLVIKLYL
jgi:hypothetical protein